MSSIDERVVEMKFKDSSFQEGVARTLQGLKDLKDGLKLDGAAKGLEDIGVAADGVDLDGLKSDVVTINPLFAALATVGVTALSRLTNAALDFGKNLVANVMEPLFEGGQRRALNLEGARYSFKMLGIDATQAMNDANYAVEGTAFSLDVAAKAASQLSASQVQLGDDMKASLRGISGVAALTNSSYEDISNVFTKVAGQGRLMGDDLNRLGSRGMNAAAVLAKAFGTTEAGIRKMVSEGKISFLDFARAMDNAYGAQAVSAAETYSGALGQMRTAIARIGADLAAPKLEALRRIYNALAPAINGVKFAIQPLLDMFGQMQTMKADGIVAMLEDIVKVGFGNYKEDKNSPLVALQQGFKNIADSIMNVVRPIREAWNAVFPPSLGGMLAKFSFWFRDITESLKISGDAAKVIKTIFTGLFSVLKIGLTIVSGVLGVAFNGLRLFFGLLSGVSGLFTPFIKYLYNLVTGIKMTNDGLGKSVSAIDIFFNALKWGQNFVLEPIIAVLKGIGAGIDAFLNDGKTAKQAFGVAFQPILEIGKKIGETFGIAGDIVQEKFGVAGKRIKAVWDGVWSVLKAVGEFFRPLADAMGPFFTRVRDGFAKMFEGADFNTILATINTGVLLMFAKSISKAIGNISDAFTGVADIKNSFTGALDGVTESLEAFQKKLKADAILKIAIAIGVLAGSLVLLATVEPDRMISAAVGLGVVAGALLLAMDKFSELASAKGMLKMPFISYAMILLGTAMITMATAVKIMSSIKWDELLRGLTGFAVVLAGLMGAAKLMSGFEKDIVKVSAALLVLGIALNTIVGAIVVLGKIKFETLIQGLGGLGITLGMLVAATAILSANAGGMTKAAGGILAMAGALSMLSGVVIIFGLIPFPVLERGLTTLGIMLAGLVVVANILSANAGGMTKAAGGLLAMAAAIGMLVSAVVILGMINLGTLIQGLVGAAAAIAILVVAAKAMSGVEKGAVGLIALSGALLIMAVSLKLLSTIPLEAMLISLVALGALLIMLGFAATVLGPLAPQLMLLSGAFALFGVALALISGAMLLFTIAIASLGPAIIALVAGLNVFADSADRLIAAVPAMLAVGAGLIVFGAGAAIAGIGIGLLGIALIAMGAGLAIIGAVGIIGATALTAVAIAIANLIQYAPQLIAMGAALIVLGAGLVVAGAGLIIVGAGVLVIAAGLLVLAAAVAALGPAMILASSGLQMFLPMVGEFVGAVPGMLALGAGLIGFGVGAGIAALGIGALGIALVVLGAGLMVVDAAGSSAAKVIKKVTETVAGLWGHAVNIGIVATALGALGIALVALGGGLLLTGSGALVVVAAMMAFVGMANLFAAAINMVIVAVTNLNKISGTMNKSAAALNVLGAAITALGMGSLLASNGILAITINFAMLSNAATSSSSSVSASSKVIQTSLATMVASSKTVAPAYKDMSNQVLSVFTTLVDGINKSANNVKSATTTLGNTVKSSVASAVNSAKASASTSGESIGTAITDGMARGLSNGNSKVSSAAKRVAANALAAAKKELDSHSPSKKFIKLGEDSDEGFALGLEGEAGRVAKAASGVGGTAIFALKKSISDISNSVAIDPNMNPVIRPILDLSLVKKAAPEVGTLLKSPTLDVGSNYREASSISVNGVGGSESGSGTNVTNVTFNQTNNSPKALSDAEIYRQTNNQVSRLEKGVGASNVD